MTFSPSVSSLFSRTTKKVLIPAFFAPCNSPSTSLKNVHILIPVRSLISSYPFSSTLLPTPKLTGSKSANQPHIAQRANIQKQVPAGHRVSYAQKVTFAPPHSQKNK